MGEDEDDDDDEDEDPSEPDLNTLVASESAALAALLARKS